jgi:transposase InsO family protein
MNMSGFGRMKFNKPKDENPSDGSDDDKGDDDGRGEKASWKGEKGDPKTEMMPYFIKRERMFPCANSENIGLYRDRYSILESEWRMPEIYRFGILTNFPESLYPYQYRKFYDCLRMKNGLEPLWFPQTRSNSMSDELLPQFYMTYSTVDRFKFINRTTDFDLNENSDTIVCLPLKIRKLPQNWYAYKNAHEPPKFSELAQANIDDELIQKDKKRRNALQEISAKTALKSGRETIPKLEAVSEAVTYLKNAGIKVELDEDTLDAREAFINREKRREYLPGQNLAENANVLFKNVLSLLPVDTRAAVMAALASQGSGEANRFLQIENTKKVPVSTEKFNGKETYKAPAILAYILVTAAEMNMNWTEIAYLIRSNMIEDALLWYNNNTATFEAELPENKLYRFVLKFKNTYMNRNMSRYHEATLKRTHLQSSNIHSLDIHYNTFTRTANNLRACDETISDRKLVDAFYYSLTPDLQIACGVESVDTCKTVDELFQKAKRCIVMIKKSIPQYDNDMMNANSLHVKQKNKNDMYENVYENDSENEEEKYTTERKFNENDTFNFAYPDTDSDYTSMYNSQILDMYFHTKQVTQNLYTRDLICFHCGDKGHRAGWKCPLVRLQKPQTPRGQQWYAEWQKKYAREQKTYDIKAIMRAEEEFWSKRGKDIRTIVEQEAKRKGPDPSKAPRRPRSPTMRTENSSYNPSEDLRQKIKDSQNRQKNRPIVDMVSEDDDEVQSVNKPSHNNGMGVYMSLGNKNDDFDLGSENYVLRLNTKTTESESENFDTEAEHEKMQILENNEKKFAYPLVVCVELNSRKQNMLLDHGATRNLCRKSVLEREYGKTIYHEKLPGENWLISSSGTRIPIKTRVRLSVKLAEYFSQDALFYVVSDSPSRDITVSFVLGRTFLGMSGLCYDYGRDMLFDPNHTNTAYMRVKDGRIYSEQGGKSDIAPLCSLHSSVTHSDRTLENSGKIEEIELDTQNKTEDSSYVESRSEKISRKISEKKNTFALSKNLTKNEIKLRKNNKIKNDQHKQKMQARETKKQAYVQMQIKKSENIMHAFSSILESEKCSHLTPFMRTAVLDRVAETVDKYDLLDVGNVTKSHMTAHLHANTVTDDKKEKFARLSAYLHAYETTAEKSSEGEILVEQVMKLMNDHGDKDEDKDPEMQKINDIDELAAPQKQDLTPDLEKQKTAKVDEMIDKIDHLTANQKLTLKTLLTKNLDVYSLAGENFKQTDIVEHEINLVENAKPFHQKLRIYSPALQAIMDTEVMKMIQDGIIVKSNSQYASNLLLVRKPDPSSPGGIKNRVCVNFIALNDRTVKDRYPLPNQDAIFRQIGSASWFSTFDLMSGFWQIAIKPEHRSKTAFITSRGLYEFLVMPFGLCNAPATFQRMMDKVIKPEYRQFLQTFVDDIIAFSKSFESHIEHLTILHDLLRKNNLTVKLSKCHFAQKEVKFLGHVISDKGISPNPEKIEAVKKWEKPLNVDVVRSFLGLMSWYRKFIPKFAEVAQPLYALLKKDAVYEWTEECASSFEKLKNALVSSPVLKQADFSKDFYLHTDSSLIALGTILKQKDENGDLHPIAYASKALNSAQQNYSASERECLALVWALEHFNAYLEGHDFTCLTDHRALTYLVGKKECNNSRITRWILRLQPYNLKVEYLKGSENNAADLLSRPNLMNNFYMEVDENHLYFHGSESRRSTRLAKIAETRSEVEKIATDLENKEILESKNVPENTRTKEKKVVRPKRSVRAKAPLPTYDVEAILDKRKVNSRSDEYEYLVKWKNYGFEKNTWEPLKNLGDSINLVYEFERKWKLEHADTDENVEINLRDDFQCAMCGKVLKTEHDFYVHGHNEHQIPVPKLDSEMGLIDEIDDKLLARHQKNDESLKYIYDSNLGENISVAKNQYEKKSLENYEFFETDKGVLYTINTDSKSSSNLRLVAPKLLRRKILSEVHDGLLSAHPGISHMTRKVAEIAWWPRWRSDIIRYVLQCEKCQRAKQRAMISQLPRAVTLASRPFQHIGVDVVGPFPVSQQGNVYILTVVDHFTRWAEAIPMKEQTTKSIAQAIIKYVICRHGLFDVMTSDNGSVFVSELANYIYKELGIKRVRTTPVHPQSNGIPERFNGTLKSVLKLWCNEEQDNWDEYLPYALFAYNTAFHTILQETPFFLINGRNAKLLADILVNRGDEVYVDQHDYGKQLVEKLRNVYDRIKKIYEEINEKRETDIENKSETHFEVGQKVLVYDPTTKVGLSRKMTVRWKGPYIITEKVSDVNYVIHMGGKVVRLHKHRLRPYHSTPQMLENANDSAEFLREEIDRINELELELRVQKAEKKHQLEIAEAQRVVSKNDKDEVNDVPLIANPNIDITESDIRYNSCVYISMLF